MASDKKQDKEQKLHRTEDATTYIPIDIIELILMQMNPKNAVRLSTACKKWRTTAPSYDPTMGKTPWLVKFNHDNKCSCILQSVLDEGTSFEIRLPKLFLRSALHYFTSDGWLLRHCKDTISLYHPFSKALRYLPPLESSTAFFYFFYMSSSPSNSDCVVLAKDTGRLLVWRPGDISWTIEVSVDFEYLVWSTVRFQGQFYSLRCDNGQLVCFQILPFRIKNLGVAPPMELPIVPYYGGVFLVESCGKILLVYVSKIKEIYLFELDLENKTWIKMKGLGDRALFLLNSCFYGYGISVSVAETKCRGNSIYYIDRLSRQVFIIENHNIKVIVEEPDPDKSNFQLWLTPNSIINKKQVF